VKPSLEPAKPSLESGSLVTLHVKIFKVF
jgi:hypothetical protein